MEPSPSLVELVALLSQVTELSVPILVLQAHVDFHVLASSDSELLLLLLQCSSDNLAAHTIFLPDGIARQHWRVSPQADVLFLYRSQPTGLSNVGTCYQFA